MTLRDAIEHYIVWRRAHGAKFTTAANLLRSFLGHADGNAACDAVTMTQVVAFLAGEGPLTRHRENKYYVLAGFGGMRSAAATQPFAFAKRVNRDRRSDRRPTSTRATNCDGSSIRQLLRSAVGARSSWTR